MKNLFLWGRSYLVNYAEWVDRQSFTIPVEQDITGATTLTVTYTAQDGTTETIDAKANVGHVTRINATTVKFDFPRFGGLGDYNNEVSFVIKRNGVVIASGKTHRHITVAKAVRRRRGGRR